jgi:hypothetical protein
LINGDSDDADNWNRVVPVVDARESEELDFVPIGSILELGNETVSDYLILNGFSSPENTHRWSMGSVCSIEFKVKPEIKEKGIKIKMNISPIQNTQLGKTLEVYVNNAYLKTLVINDPSLPTILEIPASYLSSEKIKVVFETPGSITPEILNNSTDNRILARAFSTFQLIRG